MKPKSVTVYSSDKKYTPSFNAYRGDVIHKYLKRPYDKIIFDKSEDKNFLNIAHSIHNSKWFSSLCGKFEDVKLDFTILEHSAKANREKHPQISAEMNIDVLYRNSPKGLYGRFARFLGLDWNRGKVAHSKTQFIPSGLQLIKRHQVYRNLNIAGLPDDFLSDIQYSNPITDFSSFCKAVKGKFLKPQLSKEEAWHIV